ncbi:MAG: ABC transporter ATP-binding protein [Pseudomonadota bacterium]|nr:MAG: ABC transporter ATP-binding protein [Pseudomonadota bacterium]
MSTAEILAMRAVGKGFDNADRRIEVLTSVSLVVERGQRVAITGSSGSGKSTLLHLAAGMDRPDSGHIELLGHDLAQLREPDLTRLRAATVGLVFQDFNLIESLSVSENILLPAWINRRPQAPANVAALAGELGIEHVLERMPGGLSGGEKQRVAIARALIHEPGLILADEPTGSLDETSGHAVLDLLERVTRARDSALVLVTHNPAAAAVCERQLRLAHGRLVAD